MMEDEAKGWITKRFGSAGYDRCTRFIDLLARENETQNLVSKSSMTHVWSRHVVDSAQLIDMAPAQGSWLDIGTGGGFPGLVISLLREQPTTLVEPRTQRARFLSDVVRTFGLSKVTVMQSAVQMITGKFDVISARAVAPLPTIFERAVMLSRLGTVWILPKGRSVTAELQEAKLRWNGVFHVKQSVSSEASGVIVASKVRAK